MSIILQIGAPHLPSGVPVSCCDHTMGAGSEPKSMEAPVVPEDCGITQPSTTTYANCFGLPYQDHNYGAPPPPTPPQSPAKVNGTVDEDTSTSVVTTSTNNDEETVEEESITRCICDFDHDDEYMICCDKCSVWQHVDCMGLDRDNIPETYMCEKCEPRKVDKQKAKLLQAKKREELTVTGKGKKVKRQKREKTIVEDKVPPSPTKKVKRGKERTEPRRTQRKIKSSDVNHIDEDAQDSWDSPKSDWKGKYEEAETNQYSPEVHLQLGNRKLNGHRDEVTRKILKQLRVQLCRVADITKDTKGLFAVDEIQRNQAICEYRGKFVLVSQFQQEIPVLNRLHPFVLFYSLQKDQEDICVDSREYGNDARFVRRSCAPNAEVRHVVENGLLHLYIFSSQDIKQNEEVTIPFDFDYETCIDVVECACQKPNCPVNSRFKRNGIVENSGQEKRSNRRVRKTTSVSEDGSHSSLVGSTTSPQRPSQGHSQTALEQNKDAPTEETEEEPLVPPASSEASGSAVTESTDDTEMDEHSDKRKKMTREERKMEAIMKAFARLEKAEQRRQEALARLAHKKEEQELKRKEEEKKKDSVDQVQVEEVKSSILCEDATAFASTTTTEDAKPLAEEGKPTAPKPRGKGKKRKNSGTPARRRSRVNSGGSDIMSPDESASNLVAASITTTITTTTAAATTTTATITAASSTVTMAAVTGIVQNNAEIGNSASIVATNSFRFPKTKKLLMNEWFGERPDSVHQPLTIKTEPSDLTTASPTCYMRCARSPTGINTAHLRRASGGSGSNPTRQAADCSMGSAKKRWLRQAMCEEEATGIGGSPVPNGSMSPTQCASSPSTSPPTAPDLVTPLKKRRLARESMSSDVMPSTPPTTSPSIGGQNFCTAMDFSAPSCDLEDEDSHLIDMMETQPVAQIDPEGGEDRSCIPEDVMYEDIFKKDPKVSSESLTNTIIEKGDEVVPSTLGEISSEIVFNTNVSMESQEHLMLAQNKVLVDETAECVLISKDDQKIEPVAVKSTEVINIKTDSDNSPPQSPVPPSQPLELTKASLNEKSDECPEEDVKSPVQKDEPKEEENNSQSLLKDEEVAGKIRSDTDTTDCENEVEPSSCVVTADSSTGDTIGIISSSMCTIASTVAKDPITVVEKSKTSGFKDESSSVSVVESSTLVLARKLDSSPTCEPSLPTPAVVCAQQKSSVMLNKIGDGSKLVDKSNNGSSVNEVSTSSAPVTQSTARCTVEATSELSVSSTHTSTRDNSKLLAQSPCSTSLPTTTTQSQNSTKRKVSLLEYRKRKMENRLSPKSYRPSVLSTSSQAVSSTSVTSPMQDTASTPKLSTLPLFDSSNLGDALRVQTKDGKNLPEDDVRWSNAPTAVEQQRENLTQRLRREFGLITDEDSDTEKERAETVDLDGFSRTQNGRPIGCYPSHPPSSQTLVRAGTPSNVVRNIPTVIGVTGYQPLPRPPPLPPPAGPPGTATQQQYSYQHYGGHSSTFTQGAQTSQFTTSQYNNPQPRSATIRPTLNTHAPQATCAGVPLPLSGQPPPIVAQPTAYVEQHVQSQSTLRQTRPSLLQAYTDQQRHYSAAQPQSHQTNYYPQGYYQ